MKQHTYNINVEWTGNLGNGNQDYNSYSRDHEINCDDKQLVIPGSSDPSFRGDKTRYNPEELLVSTISSCHMLWYLHLCSDNDIRVISYIDSASGIMEEFKNGSGKFKSVTLSPLIVIEDYDMSHDKALSLHDLAHKNCFIANSVNFNIHVEPLIKGVEQM